METEKYYRKSANQGYVEAMYLLGSICEDEKQDYNEALMWCKKDSEHNHANAQCRLGFMYEQGEYLFKSYKKAEKYYQKAIKNGCASARYYLNNMKKYEG